MSGNLDGFNAAEVEPNVALVPVPAGDYEVIIIESVRKQNKAGTGAYLELVLQITKGQFQNRKLWDRLNIDNTSPIAQQIARGSLSAICRAVGVLTPHDSAELHNRPLVAKIVVKKDLEYGDKNEVKGYSARVLGAAPQATVTAPVQQPETTAAGPVNKPWA